MGVLAGVEVSDKAAVWGKKFRKGREDLWDLQGDRQKKGKVVMVDLL